MYPLDGVLAHHHPHCPAGHGHGDHPDLIGSWNEFFLALIFIRNPNLMTLPLGLQTFFYQYRVEWNYLFAALSMAILPILAVYLVMQRQFISGLTAGAVRG